MCVDLCSFIPCVDSSNYHSQDAELFHHQKGIPLCYLLGWRKEKQGHANRTERCHRGGTDQTPKSVPYMERAQLSLNSILMCQLRPGCQPPPSWKEKKFLVVYYVTFS